MLKHLIARDVVRLDKNPTRPVPSLTELSECKFHGSDQRHSQSSEEADGRGSTQRVCMYLETKASTADMNGLSVFTPRGDGDNVSGVHPTTPTPDEQQGRSTSRDTAEQVGDIPAAPVLLPESHIKIFRLAKEVNRRAGLMTAGRDLHHNNTVLHLLTHWQTLSPSTRNYAAHR
jgi:hypothetical protein